MFLIMGIVFGRAQFSDNTFIYLLTGRRSLFMKHTGRKISLFFLADYWAPANTLFRSLMRQDELVGKYLT